jgi:hypothetical protein
LEDEISLRLIRFFLDSSTRENYTFVSCFIYVNAASMVNIDLGAQANATKAKHQCTGNTLRERDVRVP